MTKPDRSHPLRKYREERGLSQEALGKMLGVTSTTVHRWEKGDRIPRRGQWPTIRKLTKLDIADFSPHAKASAGAAA